jgi:hypothetical protein
VARETLVGVEAGPEPIVRASLHNLDFSEPALPILKECSFVGSKAFQGSAGTRRATAHARVYWGWFGLTESADAWGQGHSHDSAKRFACNSPEFHHYRPP